MYSNGQLLAEYTSGTTYFVSADHLSSTRLLTNYNGPSVIECDDYYPFGELISCGGTSTTTHKFTGKERDSESNLDNFGARYDSSAMGRFMSPDWSAAPAPVPFANTRIPQTLNLYAYAQNNPLTFTDPDGHCTVDGETHGGFWCFLHSVGLEETKAEKAADAKAEAEQEAWRKEYIRTHPWQIWAAFSLGVAGAAVPDGELNPAGDSGESDVSAPPEEAAGEASEITAANGTKITGFTKHGINRAIGDTYERLGVTPEAIRDALRNPLKIVGGTDNQGRPFQIFTGKDARVVVNPQSGQIVSVNPLSGGGAH